MQPRTRSGQGDDGSDAPTPRWTRRTRPDPASFDGLPTSLALPDPGEVGGRGGTREMNAQPVPVRFADVDARARRLIVWSAEESEYLRSHDVTVFSPSDRAGRDYFADESLYELLPRLRGDAAQLRLECGPGPLSARTKKLIDQAARDVQAYYELWTTLRQQVTG